MSITEKKINRILQTDSSSVFQLKVSREEFDAMNKCNRDIRYKYVMKRIADTETLWSIAKDESAIIIQVQDGIRLFPVWSSKEYGISFCECMSSNCTCLPISLDDFVEYFIDLILDEDLLVNVFPTPNEPLGKIVTINQFADCLGEELEEYE